MAVTYDGIEDGRVVLQYWHGTVNHDDLVIHEQQHLTDPRITPGASVLVDAREAHCGTTSEDVREIVNGLYAIYQHPLNIRKCALLVNAPTYPLVRAYEKSADKYGISVIAFSFLDGACAWLGLDVTIVRTHLERMRRAHAAAQAGA